MSETPPLAGAPTATREHSEQPREPPRADAATDALAAAWTPEPPPHLMALLDALPHGVAVGKLIRDDAGDVADWRWLWANPAFVELTGGRDLAMHLASEATPSLASSGAAALAIARAVARGDAVAPIELPVGTAGRWVAAQAFPIGTPDLVGVLARDVTSSHLAEDAHLADELRSRAIIDSLAEGVVVQNAAGKIVLTNPAARTILGLSVDELTGATSFDPRFEAIWPDGRPAPGDEHPATIVRRTGQAMRGVLMGMRTGGSPLCWVELDAVPLAGQSGAAGGVVISFSDVTDRRDAESRLAASERMLQRSQAMAHVGSWAYDVATGTVAWTDETYRIHDLEPGAFDPSVPATDIDFYAPGDKEVLAAAFDAARRDGTRYDLELELRTAAGRPRWVRTSCQAEFQAGRVTGLYGQIQDVTDSHLATEEARLAQARLMRLIDSNIVGIVIADAAGSVLEANDYYLGMIGATREEFEQGRLDWRRVTPPEWIPADERAIAELRARGVCTPYEKEYQLPGGRRVQVFLADTMLPGPGELIAAIAVDISDRKRAEREVLALNAELEERVATRTAALETANRELESFSYSVSHDLRAPLRAIDAFGGILASEHADRLDAEGLRVLGVIRRNAQQMGCLIDDLLAFSRVGRRTLERRRVDMTALARAVAEELALGTDRVPTIDIGELCPVAGDPLMLRQIWANLLANAVKFTRPVESGLVVVRCTPDPDGRSVGYTVADNGVGYDPAYADKLFQPFQRLHPASQFEGSGIGLAIVARIVARHGGRVWSEGAPGQGATFGFSLPLEGSDGA